MNTLTLLTYFLLTFLLLTILLLALPHMLPQSNTTARYATFYIRSTLSFTCLAICAIYGVFASLFLRCIGYAGLGQYFTARAFAWMMKLACGVEFVVQGSENLDGRGRPYVLVGNHQTELDVAMLGAVFPPYCSVTAKRSLKYTPFLGQFMSLSKTVFIDRTNSASARSAFDSAATMMNTERQSVFIFPEGTRSYASQPDMLPFKKGAFHLAVKAQVPIVPIVVANYANTLHMQSKTFGTGRVPVKVLPPIPTKGLTPADVDGLVQKTRDAMMEELLTLTEIARGQNIAPSAERAKELDRRNEVKTTGRDAKQPAVSRQI